MGYRFLEHTADVKFRAVGSDLGEMFVSAAGALAETIRGDIKILEMERKTFVIEGKDIETLLHDFLEEFLFLLDSEDFLMARIASIKFVGKKVECVVFGDKAERYKFTNDVKAVTFNDMYVRKSEGEWVCQVVLDV